MTVEALVHQQGEDEHRISDALFVAGAQLPLWIAKAALLGAAESHGETETFYQTRVGQNGELFQLAKLRTQYEDTGLYYSRIAEFFRKTGIDELSQLENIRAGEMTLFGARPLTPEEYVMFLDGIEESKVRDRWLKLVLPKLPGDVSSYGIGNHIKEVSGIDTMWGGKAELDIKDVVDDSPLYRMRMLRDLIKSVRSSRRRKDSH